jgi:hypothetical protein
VGIAPESLKFKSAGAEAVGEDRETMIGGLTGVIGSAAEGDYVQTTAA